MNLIVYCVYHLLNLDGGYIEITYTYTPIIVLLCIYVKMPCPKVSNIHVLVKDPGRAY